MNKMNWKWTLVCAAALVGATALPDAQAWAGKPGGDPPPLVNPTPIVYQIKFWISPNGVACMLRGTNNLGQTVGEFSLPDGDPNTMDALHAFLYDPALNNPAVLDPATAIDLHAEMVEHRHELFNDGSDGNSKGILYGWVIASATDINDYGVIVGYLEPEILTMDRAFRRGYVLDTRASLDASNWTFSLLPTDDWSYPEQINEDGDIAGRYQRLDTTWDTYFIAADTDDVVKLGQSNGGRVWMNNSTADHPTQIAFRLSDGRAFRWTNTIPATTVIFNLNSPIVNGINDFGTICGSTRATFSSKAKTGTYAMRYDGTQLDIWSSMPGLAYSINSAGDLTVAYLPNTERLFYVYHSKYWGFVRLDALIDPDDQNAAAWFSGRGVLDAIAITDCIAPDLLGDYKTEFGLVSGCLSRADGVVYYLLTPVKK